jgi:NAD(P)-dependent dehydrogenase (short-subunit alcohol dehydrogenase family)
MSLAGKVAVITGASRGIGRATALELARAGAAIVVAARTDAPRPNTPGTVQETVEAIRALGARALAVRTDLSRQEDIENLHRQTLETFGRADILVNNAAYTVGRALFAPLAELTREQWEAQIAVNLTAPLMLTKLFSAEMKRQGGGVILNLTSGAANFADLDARRADGLAYGVTKAGLNRLGNALAAELKPHNIAVITVDPGGTMTELMETFIATAPIAIHTHPMAVPARTIGYLVACTNPLEYSGRVVVAADFAREHGLS